MQRIKKYAAILLLLLVYPIVYSVANLFVLEEGDEIYAYIPQESDLVIEINTRNFASELAYQRIFEEAYFMEKVYPDDEGKVESRYVETGLDVMSKFILFREQWANESIWIAIVKYSNQEMAKNYLFAQMPNSHVEFSDDYAIIQLSVSSSQENLTEHLKKIADKEVKSFNERAILSTVFDPTKEINCYIIPKTRENNQLIDGYVSFDFLGDQIAIAGSFTPISNFGETEPIAYAIDPEKALSMRSSFNFFNSIYWFNSEKIENVPEYKQIAFDYDGVECFMVHRELGFTTPFKSYPKIDLHFDILKKEIWYAFMDSLKKNPTYQIDTVQHTIITAEGAHFTYAQNDRVFELTQDSVTLNPANDPLLYFDLQLNFDALLDRTTFSVDENHPPSDLEQQFGLMAARGFLSEIKLLANMESGTFQLRGTDDGLILASGQLLMKEKNGSALIESLAFGSAAFSFLQSYF